MFYDDAVAESTLEWVRNYPQKAGYESFSPHITLGYGQVQPAFPFPAVFTVARLALCHLGNHATCRKLLAAVDLPLRDGMMEWWILECRIWGLSPQYSNHPFFHISVR